jgi:NADH-quinone oxidoreductase subunit N
LLSFTALIIWLTMLTGIPDTEDSADFYVLLLGATLGMSVMASANHLLMIFIGIEMASIPSFALAGFFLFFLTTLACAVTMTCQNRVRSAPPH